MKKSIGSGRGSVYNIILKALQSGDKYGYEICKEVEEKTDGAYILKQPSLYSGLKRLEAQGDVKSYWRDSILGGRRHYYSLTENGRDRIERSDFNWQDARDEIVGNLFEKSEVDEKIESVESQINDLKAISAINEERQRDIDDVLKSTEVLYNESKEKKPLGGNVVSFENGIITDNESKAIQENDKKPEIDSLFSLNDSADDLFSMFNNFNSDDADKDDKNEANNDIRSHEIVRQKNDISFKSDENKFIKKTLNELDEKSEGIGTISKSNTQSEQLDLFYAANNIKNEKKESEFSREDSHSTLKSQNELLNNYDECKMQETANDNIDKKNESVEQSEVILEKNTEDVLTEYRSQNVGFETYSDISLFEEPGSSIAKHYNDDEGQNTKLNNDSQYATQTEEDVENNLSDSQKEKSITTENKKEFSEIIDEKNENNLGLDYKNIFGDLMSSKSKDSELDDDFVYNTLGENESEFVSFNNDKENTEGLINEQSLISNFIDEETKKESKINIDLPRDEEAIKDINRTLFLDDSVKTSSKSNSDFESYDQTPFKEMGGFENSLNPFEKYNTYQNIEETQRINNTKNAEHNSIYSKRTSDLAFDKKYANVNNRFDVPDYEVRYYNKYNNEIAMSKYISINKLNLVKSFVLSILICLITTLTLVVASANVVVEGFQMFLFIASYLIGFVCLIFSFLKYSFNKHKKTIGINKSETMFSVFIAIGLVTLAIVTNIALGMNSSNIFGYFASFILPIFYGFVFIINYPLKKFLSKFAGFYD